MSLLRTLLGLGKKNAEHSPQRISRDDHQEPLFTTQGTLGLADWAAGEQVLAE
jgi:hypothetical protein